MTIFIDGENVRLFTTVYPKENAETIILLHGGPGVPDDLALVAYHLSENYQIISFHQRGTKKSPVFKSDFTIESYITDIDSISAYFKLTKFHLFGHSWGGLYAQIYAQKYPDKILSLFLSSPSSGTNYQWKETEKEVMAFNRSKLSYYEWLSMGWNSLKGIFGSDRAYQKLFNRVLENYNKGFEDATEGSIDLKNIKAAPINKTRKQLIRYPVLNVVQHPDFRITITYGEKDIYGESKKYSRERYPTAVIHTIEKCGHLPALQCKSRYFELLNAHYKS